MTRYSLVQVTAPLALLLVGCTPDTITPLRATDGEPPARDVAPEFDETVIRPDAARADSTMDAACPLDAGFDGGCADAAHGDDDAGAEDAGD